MRFASLAFAVEGYTGAIVLPRGRCSLVPV